MTPNYTYVNSPDYINSLSFDYVETYSFQRGEEYERNLKLLQTDHDKLKAGKEHHKRLTTDEERRYEELHKLVGFTQYLIDDEGQFHPSSKRVNIFRQGEPIVDRLITILRTEIKDMPMWMCAPTYRDAFVFRNNSGDIISVLNVCLSCQYMETKMFNHINGDYETYDLLKRYFIDIGHDIEEPTKFVLDDIKRMKSKQDKSKAT